MDGCCRNSQCPIRNDAGNIKALPVTPTKAGVQGDRKSPAAMDSRFRGNDVSPSESSAFISSQPLIFRDLPHRQARQLVLSCTADRYLRQGQAAPAIDNKSRG